MRFTVQRHTGCKPASRATPANGQGGVKMRADTELAVHVRDMLSASRRDLCGIAVLVTDGQVRLFGPVRSFYLRQVAVEKARRVPGVRHVADEMIVEDGEETNWGNG